MAFFILEAGISTVSFFAVIAFLILVSISAIGSVIFVSSYYQLDFLTPGISPLYARFLKQIRQTPYFLKTAWGLPQILHLV